jgi:CHAD domain-containing protein
MSNDAGIRQFAFRQAAALLGRFAFELHRSLQTSDPEAVHDLRVSIRRFSQALQVFAPFFPPRVVKRIRRRLRAILDAASQVRDRDIALEFLDRAGLPPEAPLRAALKTRRAEAERAFKDLLKDCESRGFSSRWRSRLHLAAT